MYGNTYRKYGFPVLLGFRHLYQIPLYIRVYFRSCSVLYAVHSIGYEILSFKQNDIGFVLKTASV